MNNLNTLQLSNPLHLLEQALIAKGHSSESARAMIKKSLGVLSLGDAHKVNALLTAFVEGVQQQAAPKGGQAMAASASKAWSLLAEEIAANPTGLNLADSHVLRRILAKIGDYDANATEKLLQDILARTDALLKATSQGAGEVGSVVASDAVLFQPEKLASSKPASASSELADSPAVLGWLAPLALLGGGSSSAGGISLSDIPGQLINGYLYKSVVFQDLNGDGVWQSGEPFGITDREGRFEIEGVRLGAGAPPLVAIGGYDLSIQPQGVNLDLPTFDPEVVNGVWVWSESAGALVASNTLRAPASSSVVTPLTTLIQALVDSGSAGSPEAAATMLAQAFGIDPSVDLLTFDPVGSALEGNPNAVLVKAASTMVANLMDVASTTLGALGGGASNTGGLSLLVASSIAQTLAAGQGQNSDFSLLEALSDPAVLRNVIESAAQEANPGIELDEVSGLIGALSNSIAAVNTIVNEAVASGDPIAALQLIAQAQKVAQTDLGRSFLEIIDSDADLSSEDALADLVLDVDQAVEDAGDDIPTVTPPSNYTGDTLGAAEEDEVNSVSGQLNAPSGSFAGFQAVTGQLSAGQYGTYSVTDQGNWTFTLTDKAQTLREGQVITDTFVVRGSAQGSPTQIITITITGTNDAPIVANDIVDTTFSLNQSNSFEVPANTFSDIDAGTVLTYEASLPDGKQLPDWLSFDAQTRIFTGQPPSGQQLTVRVTASDGLASVFDDFTITFTSAPVVQSLAVSDNNASNGVALGKAGEALTFVLTLSSQVTSTGEISAVFTVGGVDVNATASRITAASSTITFQPLNVPAGANGAVSLKSIVLTGIVDANNQTLLAPTPGAIVGGNYVVDTVAPTVVITDNADGVASGDITYTFTFSEPVTGFTAGDVIVTNGSKGTFTAQSTTVYTLVVTPDADFEGDVTVDVAAGAASDAAGNASTAAVQSVQAVDTLAPAAPVVNAVATDNIINAQELLALASNPDAVVFSGTAEPGSTIRLSVLSFNGGPLEGDPLEFIVNSEGEWVITVDDLFDGDDDTLDEGDYVLEFVSIDPLGNESEPTEKSFKVDTTAPLQAIIVSINQTQGSQNGTLTNDDTPVIVVEAEAGALIRVGSMGSLLPSTDYSVVESVQNPGTYTITFSEPLENQGYGIVAVDQAGNFLSPTPQSSATFRVDTVAPTVVITDNADGVASGDITYTFTFSEPVNGFTADDVIVTNGSKGTFTAQSTTVYTLVVTPDADFEGDVTVDVAADAASDAAGNASTAAVQSVQAVDTAITDFNPEITLTNFNQPNFLNLFDGNPETTGLPPSATFSSRGFLFEHATDENGVNMTMTLKNEALGDREMVLSMNGVKIDSVIDPNGGVRLVLQQQTINAELRFAGQNIGTFVAVNLDADDLLISDADSQEQFLDLKIANIISKATNSALNDAFSIDDLSNEAAAELGKALISALTHNLSLEDIASLVRNVITLPSSLQTIGDVVSFVQDTFTQEYLSSLTFEQLQDRADLNLDPESSQSVISALAILAAIAPTDTLSTAMTKIANSGLADLSVETGVLLSAALLNGGSIDNLLAQAIDLFQSVVVIPDNLNTVGELAGFVQDSFSASQLESIKLGQLESFMSDRPSVEQFLDDVTDVLDLKPENSLSEVLTQLRTHSFWSRLELDRVLPLTNVSSSTIIAELVDVAVSYLYENSSIDTLAELATFVQNLFAAPILTSKTYADMVSIVDSNANSDTVVLLLNAMKSVGNIQDSDSLSLAFTKVSQSRLGHVDLDDLVSLLDGGLDLTSSSGLSYLLGDLVAYSLEIADNRDFSLADLIDKAVDAVTVDATLLDLISGIDTEPLVGVDADVLALMTQILENQSISYADLIPFAAHTFLGSQAEVVFSIEDIQELNIKVNGKTIDSFTLEFALNYQDQQTLSYSLIANDSSIIA